VQTEAIKERLHAQATDPNLTVSKSRATDKIRAHKRAKAAILKEMRLQPVPFKALDPADGQLHGISTPEANAWRQSVHVLLTCYREAASIANARSSHTHAWEASFSYLYQQEMEATLRDPEHAPRNPHEHAMRMAKLGVGQPQPRADRRFHVEAFWTTVDLRLAMVEMAMVWIDALSSRPSYPKENRRLWELYAAFILQTCSQDQDMTMRIAEESESHRQVVKTCLLGLRIGLETFRFNVKMMQSTPQYNETRVELADRARARAAEAKERQSEVLVRFRATERTNRASDEDWLNVSFIEPGKLIIEEWEKLERSIRMDTFYEPVSLKEMCDVVKALGFSHTGHFYKCPNGHTFTIGECGGAMERSICPECGAAIGGSSHNLLSTNRPDDDFEKIAREHGAQRSPWAWGV